MANTFTDRSVAALPKPSPQQRQRDYWESKSGLGVRVSYGGTKTFIVRYRIASGQRRRFKLGEYPDMTLEKARREAGIKRGEVFAGRDPAAEREAERSPADTFLALAIDYMENHAKPHKKSWRDDQRNIDNELSALKPKKLGDIKRRDVHALVFAIAGAPRRKPAQALAVLGLLHKMFAYGLATDRYGLDFNPAHGVARPGKKGQRTRVLTDAEIRELWQALSETPETAPILANGQRATRLQPDLNDGMKLRLLTAQRGGEIFSMRWADLDFDQAVWTIPAEVAKNGSLHVVPLASDALAILQARYTPGATGYVFARASRRTGEPIDMVKIGRKAANYLVKGRSPRKQTTRRKLTGPGITFPHFTGHDLRRTAATRMAEAGISHEHIARVLNHRQSGPAATAVYNRHGYLAEKRAALLAWERRLRQIITNAPANNVVSFSQAV